MSAFPINVHHWNLYSFDFKLNYVGNITLIFTSLHCHFRLYKSMSVEKSVLCSHQNFNKNRHTRTMKNVFTVECIYTHVYSLSLLLGQLILTFYNLILTNCVFQHWCFLLAQISLQKRRMTQTTCHFRRTRR